MAYTITYNESEKGWTSFHSFIPDWMGRLNNRFFTIKGGQLYLHNDEENPVRNNFYGTQYPTTLTYFINVEPSAIKVAKTISTESNKAFNFSVKGYLGDEQNSVTLTSLSSADFLNKEGRWHAYLRRSELSADSSPKNIFGIGVVDSVSGFDVTLNTTVPTVLLSVGDSVHDESFNELGVIQNINGDTITLDSLTALSQGDFIVGSKNSRVEGSSIRGYNFEVSLTDNSSTRTEVYAVNSQLFKSEPS